MKAIAGRPLALECVVRGHPPPTLSWHHEGLPVVESNGTWLEAGGSVLSLESLGAASGGLYSCVASGPAGEAVRQYSVEVQGEPGPPRPVTWAAWPFAHTDWVRVPEAQSWVAGALLWGRWGGGLTCLLPFSRHYSGTSSGPAPRGWGGSGE